MHCVYANIQTLSIYLLLSERLLPFVAPQASSSIRCLTDHHGSVMIPHILSKFAREGYTSMSFNPNRMLKKSTSFVLASFKGSTYDPKYASPLRSLRPRWMVFLNILPTILIRLAAFKI